MKMTATEWGMVAAFVAVAVIALLQIWGAA